MSHDREHKIGRLRGIALQFERGEMDGEFAVAIKAGVDIAPLRKAAVERCRWLADELEGQQ
jgi:hypothetical protein